MSVFRPAAKVQSPDGRGWEIYAYRFRWNRPKRRRDVFRAIAVAARAAIGDDWTIEAVTYDPPDIGYRWSTTSEWKGQVLAQVEGHLARGDVPQRLTHADYRGAF